MVVPKAIRDSLGLHEGSRLRLEVHGGVLAAVPEPDAVRVALEDGFPVIRGGVVRKAGATVAAIKADRQRRDRQPAAAQRTHVP